MRGASVVAVLVALAAGALWLVLRGERGAATALVPGDPGPASVRADEAGSIASVEALEASESARGAELVTLRGEVLELPGGRALADVAVVLSASGEVLAEVRSDDSGAFSFRCANRTDLRIEPRPPATHWAPEPSMELGARPARKALRVALVPADRARWRGRVVDDATGEAVPRLWLRVTDGDGGCESLRTDDAGRFETEGFPRGGELRASIELSDGDPPLVEERIVEHRASMGRSVEALLRARIGPTYALRLDAPSGLRLDDLRAHLLGIDVAYSPQAALRSTRVEAGEPPWVRFAPLPYDLDAADLVLRTHDGAWMGRAVVPTGGVAGRAPVAMRLEAMATLRGFVRDARGAAVPGARVHFARLDGGGAPLWTERSAGNGLFLVRGVPPGRYALDAIDTYAGAGEEELELRGGELAEIELRLEPYPIGGDVEGVVRSTTGAFQAAAQVLLTELGDSARRLTRRASVEWREEPGEHVGRFRVEAVPRGRFALTLWIGGAPYRVDPERVELAPPATQDFVVHDEIEAFRMAAWAVDSVSQRFVDDARITIRGSDGSLEFEGPIDEWPAARLLAADHALRWEVRAPGYDTVRGDRSALQSPVSVHWRYLRVVMRQTD